MATTKTWTLNPGISTQYFAGGDATSWCQHTLPSWTRTVTVYNRGTGILYVSVPGLTGAAAATDACVEIGADAARSFFLGGTDRATITTLSTWGADGAAHTMDIVFEAR